MFTITDDRISRAILDAHRRGVKVRIITDNEKADDPGSDMRPVRARPASRQAATVRPPTPCRHMHHKFAIFDGARLLNGSYNWTRGAADINYENLDRHRRPDLLAAFAAEFETVVEPLLIR